MLTRRQLLSMAAMGGVGAAFGSDLVERLRKGRHGIIEGGLFDLPYSTYGGRPLPAEIFTNKAAFRWEVTTPNLKVIPISVPAHSIEPVPGTKHLSIATPKNSNVISLINWSEGVEAAKCVQPDGCFFYGHCGFTSDGSSAIAISWNKNGAGELVICDLKDLKRLETIPNPYGRPHQMLALNDREYLVGNFNNSRYGSALVIADIQTRQVSPVYLDYDDSEQRIVGHFVKLDSSRICWTANTHRPSGVVDYPSLVIYDLKTKSHQIHRFVGELTRGSISSTVYEPSTGTIWFTMSAFDSVFQFDLERREIVRRVQMPLTVWGLSAHLDSRYVYATSDHAIWRIDRQDATVPIERVAQTGGIAGMHTSWRES